MEQYDAILRKDIIINSLLTGVLLFAIIFSTILFIKLFQKLEIESKYNIIAIIVGVCFTVGLFVINFFETYGLVLDVKEKAYINYSGYVEYLPNQSGRHTDLYQLKDNQKLIVEAPSRAIKPKTNTFEANIIYGEHSKRILKIEYVEGSSVISDIKQE